MLVCYKTRELQKYICNAKKYTVKQIILQYKYWYDQPEFVECFSIENGERMIQRLGDNYTSKMHERQEASGL